MEKRMVLLVVTIITLSATVFIAAKVSIWATGKPIDMSFLGALIGAAGTIFAATVAYVAVQLQIDAVKEQTIENQRNAAKFERQQAEAFLKGLLSARDELNRVLAEFSNLSLEQDEYRDQILTVYSAGRLPLNLSVGMLPGTFYGRCQAFLQRLHLIASQIRNLSDRRSMPGQPALEREWSSMERYVRDAVSDGKKLVIEIEAEIAERKGQF